MKLFGRYRIVHQDYLDLLYRDRQIANRVSTHWYWPHQFFVSSLLFRFISEDDISNIRDEFDKNLDAYVKQKWVEEVESRGEVKDLPILHQHSAPIPIGRVTSIKTKGDRITITGECVDVGLTLRNHVMELVCDANGKAVYVNVGPEREANHESLS